MYLNYFVWLHLERNDYSTWYQLEPVGTGWFRLVPTRFQLIPSGSGWNPVGTAWNLVGTGRNRLEPTGSNRYLRGTAKYCQVPLICGEQNMRKSYSQLGLMQDCSTQIPTQFPTQLSFG